MDALYRTPFLDIFKRSEVDRDIKMMVAQGQLGLRAEEQRGCLELLVDDADQEIAKTAEASLFAARAAEAAGHVPDDDPEPEPEPEENLTPEEAEKKKLNTMQKIAALNPAQRLALAMKGTREERAILIRDPNKIVAVAVLSSPKVTESEIEGIAKMASVSEEILRIIGNTRAWMKSYRVTAALTKNPKTPVAVSMNLLSRLSEKDLKMLTSDRNVPDVLRTAARRKMAPR
jgi:hypothetical protein